jgi:hypothetical protein
MQKRSKKIITFCLRWGIAVAGIWWVLANTSFQDRLLTVDKDNHLVAMTVVNAPQDDAARFQVRDKNAPGHHRMPIQRDQVWTRPPIASAKITEDGKVVSAKVLAIRPGPHLEKGGTPAELLIRDPKTGQPARITPERVEGGYRVPVPYPLVDIGLIRLVREANLHYLLAALLILPICFLITARRWHLLLEAMDIRLTQARTLVLNMVGAFYNTFMPGSTGGDLIKA